MRVIAGSARSLPLKTLEGMDTRPTTDRIKETLFNMIQSEIPGCRFLDLYAGSGIYLRLYRGSIHGGKRAQQGAYEKFDPHGSPGHAGGTDALYVFNAGQGNSLSAV